MRVLALVALAAACGPGGTDVGEVVDSSPWAPPADWDGDPIDPDPSGIQPLDAGVDTAWQPPDDLTATYEADIHPLWGQHCIPCHIDGASGGLSLVVGYDALVDVPSVVVTDMMLIAPGDPRQSYLWRKIQGTHVLAGGSGQRMPFESSALSRDDRDLIAAWILNGVPQ